MERITNLIIKAALTIPAWIYAAILAAGLAFILIDAFIYKLH